MPHKVAVKCSQCGSCAQFEFAEVRRISRREDVDYFKQSSLFEYRLFQDSCGHYWHGAIYYAGLHGHPGIALANLPQGYDSGDWVHSKYLYRNHGLDLGSVRCEGCNHRRKHTLCWPSDAYYSVAYRHNVVWAFDRESALDLRDYLLAQIRDMSKYRWSLFLLHVPSLFKARKARDVVVKQLNRLLGSVVRGNANISRKRRHTATDHSAGGSGRVVLRSRRPGGGARFSAN